MGNASSHNAFYIQRDITEWYQDGSLWDRIAGTNGYDEFEGIFPGSYFDMSRYIKASAIGGGSSTQGGRRILIIGCNNLYNTGHKSSSDILDIEHGLVFKLDFSHIVCTPIAHFGESKMNLTNTTEGGYTSSFMNTDIIGPATTTGNVAGTINEQLYAEFGGHLKSYRELLSTEINATYNNRIGKSDNLGASNNWNWSLIQSVLMSESEVYGSISSGSSLYDIGCAKSQFSLFKLNNISINNTYSYWLKDVASATNFCMNFYHGASSHSKASDKYYVRPRFVLA